MKKLQSLKRAFTLVELIIVIAIIAILAVTAFLLLTQWLSKARDSSRASDLANLETALQISLTEKSKLPSPESSATITASGTIIGYQGVFGESSKDAVGNINTAPKDPNDKEYYIYYVDSTLTKYQIGGFAENETAYNPNNVNAVDYSKRYFTTKGNKLGILVDSNQTPINQTLTGLDVMTGNIVYTAIFDKSNKLSGTGQTLQWLQSVINNGGNGFDAPKECPNGFIPVPGNKDFNQPGFCVAKYEMKQKVGTAGNRCISGSELRNTGSNDICTTLNLCSSGEQASINLDGQIESKPEGMPIVRLNQATAIRACQQMGNGYHLITNKEWMTVARNIEQQGENWTGGVVGNGGIYRGNNYRNTATFTGNQNPNILDCQGGQDWNGVSNYKSMVSLGTSTACQLPNGRNKRALKLSNNQRIWDLAGNVSEHTNKADTIDGNGYSSGILLATDVDSNSDNWNNSATPQRHKIGWTSTTIISNSRAKYGPSSLTYGTGQGMGNLYGHNTNTISNFFIRGGDGGNMLNAGIFMIRLSPGTTYPNPYVGFRCAR